MEGNATRTSATPLEDVRLIVKLANQQYEDLIIHSEPTWTIRKLKSHLTKVYNFNPTVPEQKLIYSGQLLGDELVLKDILRSYKDVQTENHIFHLVYTPDMTIRPKQPLPKPQEKPQLPIFLENPPLPPTSSTSVDGLRRRNVTSATNVTATPTVSSKLTLTATAKDSPTASPTVPQSTATQAPSQQIPNNFNPFIPPHMQLAGFVPGPWPSDFQPGSVVLQFRFPGPFSSNVLSEQQDAMQRWLYQSYHSYMDQCLKMANALLKSDESTIEAKSLPGIYLPPPQFVTQTNSTSQTTPATQTTSASQCATASGVHVGTSTSKADFDGPSTSRAAAANFAPRVLPVISTAAEPQPAPSATTTTTPAQTPIAEPQPAPVPPAAENVEQQQPRFPNIVQEEQANRDWLDNFYSITRLVALLTVVYFYSSPLRCLVVALIAVGIYLYHNGFLHRRRLVQLNNANINNNQNIDDNNVPPENNPQGNAQVQPNAPPTADAAGGGDAPPVPSASSDPITSSGTPPEVVPSATSLIAFVRTFVVSFFASLLPETPAL